MGHGKKRIKRALIFDAVLKPVLRTCFVTLAKGFRHLHHHHGYEEQRHHHHHHRHHHPRHIRRTVDDWVTSCADYPVWIVNRMRHEWIRKAGHHQVRA